MTQYTIYCTEEQTRKALELGAPIYVYDEINSKSIDELDVYLDDKTKLNNGLYAEIPTAEQMIGWLEDQECITDIIIMRYSTHWHWDIFGKSTIQSEIKYKYRKEATLAAIDAALKELEYLDFCNWKKDNNKE